MELVMPEIYIPFDQELYDDIIRFSDGRLDPVALANSQVRSWVESSIEFSDCEEWAEDRLEDLAKKYAPHVLERWQKQHAEHLRQRSTENRPLVWKEVTIASGSDVRMFYNGAHHYAAVKGGKIVDDGEEYSPSEWASKIAGGTSRNAWRDLWFKELLSSTWVPAQLLRDQAQEEMNRRAAPPQDSQGAAPGSSQSSTSTNIAK
jgi:hypothetical protein